MQVFDTKKNIRRYILGVSLIVAAVTAAGYFTFDSIKQGEDWAGIINMSGRQRMLSQRIQLLSERVQQSGDTAETSAELRDRLRSAIDLFEASHRELSSSGPLGYAKRLTPDLKALYFDPSVYKDLPYQEPRTRSLDGQVRQLVSDARSALEPGGQALTSRGTLAALDRLALLQRLNHIVGAYEAEADLATDRAQKVVIISLGAILLIIVGQIVVSFIPSHRWTITAISRLTDLAETASAAQAEAEAALKTKANFLSNMSHEIRTPLNGIIGSLQVFSDNSLSDNSRSLIDSITQSSRVLLAIVNDILDVSKLEAGALRLNPGPVRLVDIMTSSAVLMRPMAQKKRLTLDFKHDLEPNLVVRIDQTRFAQILNNLLSNAIKFTSEGHITLEAELVEEGDGCFLDVRVRDTGCGIPEDKLSEIFDRFSQVPGDVKPEQRGTGLGLAITRDIIAMMGGALAVESRENEGSVFSFRIPIERLESAETDSILIAEVGQLSILLVEDIELNRELGRRMLMQMGHHVDVAEDGQDAFDKVVSNEGGPWDLLIVDNRMPRKSGLDLILDIRGLAGDVSTIPIIVMSADVLDDERAAFVEAGASGFVPKPVDQAALKEQIARCMIAR